MKRIRANGNQSGKPRQSGADAVSKLFIGRIEGGLLLRVSDGFHLCMQSKGFGIWGILESNRIIISKHYTGIYTLKSEMST